MVVCGNLSIALVAVCAMVAAIGFVLNGEIAVFQQFGTGGQQSQSAPPARDEPTTAFDVLQSKMYRDASAPNNVERREYTLEGWEKGTGGLMDDDRLLLGELYRDAASVFEYGLGESTKIAAHVGVPRYAGVDSDAEWVGKARTDAGMDHFRFYFADIGKTRSYGHPTDNTLRKIPYDYQIAPLVDESEAFDVYLVDGRYRVACACVSLLHALKHNGNMTKVRFAIHDYERVQYHDMEAVADVVRRSNKLAVFQMKSNATEEEISAIWEKHWWDQDR